MTAHRQLMVNMGTAVRDSSDVLSFAIQNFGRGIGVNVGAYAAGLPSENDAPFLWLFAEPTDNEVVNADETFTVHGVVGCCVLGPDGEKKITNALTERTATANGLTVNGGNAIVEELRDLILKAILGVGVGAIPERVRLVENDISHFPLDWAEFQIDYREFRALCDYYTMPTDEPESDEPVIIQEG